MLKDITVVVATHKQAPMPDDPMYLPLFVGAANRFDENGEPIDYGYARDDTGDNISKLNGGFGTQTALYWLWKNIDSEYKGLVHYRRYFVSRRSDKTNSDMISAAIKYEQIKPLLGRYKVFVPKKRHYVIESVYSHYAHTFDASHLDIARDVIEEKSPDYLDAFDAVMKRDWGHMFNMMILQRDLMDDYCSWLFDILFETYNRVDKTNLKTDFDKRFCGRISERLFNVWLQKKVMDGTLTKSDICELYIIENVNWPLKIRNFLSAKFLNKKYTASA